MIVDPGYGGQREGGAAAPDALAQIGRRGAAVDHFDRRDIRIDRGDVRLGVGQKHTCGLARRHHGGGNEISRPLPIDRAVDHDAVAETVGRDHYRTGDLELLLQRRGHAATRAAFATEGSAMPGTTTIAWPTAQSARWRSADGEPGVR